jgi:hypothetical protein
MYVGKANLENKNTNKSNFSKQRNSSKIKKKKGNHSS